MSTKKIVLFSDLSENAKEKAREWYREGNDYFFLEESITDFINEKLTESGYTVEGLNVSYSLSYSQGDGVGFGAAITDTNTKKVYHIRKGLRGNGNYIIDAIEHFEETEDQSKHEETEEAVLEKMQDIAKQAERFGYDFIESENSNENVDENIAANEYTFTIEGKRMDADIIENTPRSKVDALREWQKSLTDEELQSVKRSIVSIEKTLLKE